ncbi:unnamed protein product [Penicillium roqueforti FM164]|uniref:Uncharacterized protein n=1 Tax=Penicillium roqueforti (strain FM164) TaxID=1365484 RepID=W6R3K4_PENRF|nr:unnamed protein product [Penicillium roqueforti FM164]
MNFPRRPDHLNISQSRQSIIISYRTRPTQEAGNRKQGVSGDISLLSRIVHHCPSLRPRT